ncbi:MAG TPA: carboxymuconolactone decarboxylase family protein [Blastocatellia bacterium]|nr:carboxymuconolactone decarboxylase family protein [Blastocatellia bacterium]
MGDDVKKTRDLVVPEVGATGPLGSQDESPRERGLALLDRMLGPERAQATREAWLALAPDFERYVVEFLSGEVWSRPGLELRVKSLCTITTLAALGRNQGLELNIRMALNNGATREDIVEALLHIAPYAGFPACWEALVIADRVFKETPG